MRKPRLQRRVLGKIGEAGFKLQDPMVPAMFGRITPTGQGEVAEWSIAAVLKTARPKGLVGSNPTLSAIFPARCSVLCNSLNAKLLRLRREGLGFEFCELETMPKIPGLGKRKDPHGSGPYVTQSGRPQREIVRKLGTSDLKVAHKRVHPDWAPMDREFETERFTLANPHLESRELAVQVTLKIYTRPKLTIKSRGFSRPPKW